MIYPCLPHVYFTKVGHKGIYISRTCFPDESQFLYSLLNPCCNKCTLFTSSWIWTYLIPVTGHLRYLKLGCLENPTYVELLPHSRASLPICYCVSTLLISNSVMTKIRLCRSQRSLPTEKRPLVSPFLCRTSKSKIGLCRVDIY